MENASRGFIDAVRISMQQVREVDPDRTAIVVARRSYARFDLDQQEQFLARTECEDRAVLWLPRLLLLTGARLEEMAQLHRSWFVRRDGIGVIDLHEAPIWPSRRQLTGRDLPNPNDWLGRIAARLLLQPLDTEAEGPDA